MNILCRLGIHGKITFEPIFPYPVDSPWIIGPYGTLEGGRQIETRCRRCWKLFERWTAPPEHPNCQCILDGLEGKEER